MAIFCQFYVKMPLRNLHFFEHWFDPPRPFWTMLKKNCRISEDVHPEQSEYGLEPFQTRYDDDDDDDDDDREREWLRDGICLQQHALLLIKHFDFTPGVIFLISYKTICVIPKFCICADMRRILGLPSAIFQFLQNWHTRAPSLLAPRSHPTIYTATPSTPPPPLPPALQPPPPILSPS